MAIKQNDPTPKNSKTARPLDQNTKWKAIAGFCGCSVRTIQRQARSLSPVEILCAKANQNENAKAG
jgi:hypothetical protein